jgi:dCTP deaminase
MTILSDKQIKELALQGMITPYSAECIRSVQVVGNQMSADRKILSYGSSSYGYDLRLSPKEFRVFRRVPGLIVNPKRFDMNSLESVPLCHDADGDFFVLPSHSYGLGFAMELLHLPRNVTALFIGKSSYARVGAIANCTPGESGWKGHLTLEISNSSSADIRIYANEGIVQALFFQGEPCEVSYADRGGKYQNQGEEVVMAKV